MTALKGETPRTPVKRLDYRPPDWRIDAVDLVFELDAARTRVRAALDVRRAADAGTPDAPLVLDGDGLETRSVAVDARELSAGDYRIERRAEGDKLVLDGLPDACRVHTEVEIRPSANSALEGLYQSGSSLLTQCEAEGFRRITWFCDRPDVMARYRVRLEADRERYPVLLANGNRVDAGELGQGRHFAVWEDPFPKPCYLFAIVAGDLGCIEDRHVTGSGREVALKLYSERANLGQLDHAMRSLKKAMQWDEQRFGLEYDLDVYHIVATHDFNMGAMENKSLNIFNARYVLADPDTATDADFEAIEGVIAHEYFHNWTGNRVTCRDWFQLTLKEGLTVYRDQEFSADMQSRAVKRISDVGDLIARQFPEDAGPMAHPVRPERYVEVNNFYTATVYEKGAEVVRMYETLLGRDGFRRGMDLYFQRHDGQAVTCDDFRAAMADANDADLDQFECWYRQVGTPRLGVTSDYDAAAGRLRVELAQSLPEHRDNQRLGSLHIPIRLGLLDSDGNELETSLDGAGQRRSTHLVELREPRIRLEFSGLSARPVLSVLRGFSAPVELDHEAGDPDLACIFGHDPDPVARWRAGRELVTRLLTRAIVAGTPDAPVAPLLLDAWRSVLERAGDNPALTAQLLRLPSEDELASRFRPIPVEAIHTARRDLKRGLARALDAALAEVERNVRPNRPWRFTPDDVGGRSLANAIQALRIDAGSESARSAAAARFESADNMTDRFAALSALVHAGAAPAGELLEAFEKRYADNPLVMDKWFALQAGVARPETADRVAELIDHPAFSWRNPNKVRALLGTFGRHNPLAFHRADGAGYRLIGQGLLRLDAINPQVAARLAAVFNRWTLHDSQRRALMREQLEAIQQRGGLSPHVEEIVDAALAADGG